MRELLKDEFHLNSNSKKKTTLTRSVLKFKVLFENSQRNFYFLLTLLLITILFTHPFLRYPFDMFTHLIKIDKYYNITQIPNGREIWHFFWAKFFYFLNIPNSEVFLRAKIIHILQTYIAFFSVFFFSKIIIRNIFRGIDKTILNYLSLWSVIIWFSIFATFSVQYQLVWNLWYSINYQITLPLFWYITALTLILFLEETSVRKKVFFAIQILLLSRLILQVHSMEYLYYLMYILIFGIIYIDRVYYFFKKYFYIAIPIILSIVYFAKKYQPDNSKLFDYFAFDKLPTLYHDIIAHGHHLVATGLNRENASINELMVMIFYLSIILVIMLVLKKIILNKAQVINLRLFIFLIVTSMFVIIPVYEFSAGIFAIITKPLVVNRLYYSSSIFIILPIFVYYILYKKDYRNISITKINISIILLLSSVWFYSKYYTTNQTYYKNVKSIQNSFFERRVGFNLTQQQIEIIGEKIAADEKANISGKKIYYYARADIAFVIKYVYRKNVLWENRRSNLDYISLYNKSIIYIKNPGSDRNPGWVQIIKIQNNNKYHLVLFEVPEGFPKYKRYH